MQQLILGFGNTIQWIIEPYMKMSRIMTDIDDCLVKSFCQALRLKQWKVTGTYRGMKKISQYVESEMKRMREIKKEREKVKGKQRFRGREKEIKQTERKKEIKGAKRVNRDSLKWPRY